ncbi:MAG TPA: YIP1 family protein [Longimicrobiaceae bacterium]|jgi:hypothetical protein|nr:YIP1 family protein [Longimicrobiaceae bacterium]
MSNISTSAPIDQPATDEAPPPLLSRIGQTFVSPGKLFSTFTEEDSPWGGTLLLLMALIAICVVAQMFIIPQQMWIDFIRSQIVEAGGQAPPDEMLAQAAKTNQVLGVVIGPISQMIVTFLSAGILTLVFSMAMGGVAKFRQYMAVVTHAMFIFLLGLIAIIPLQIQSGDLALSPGLHLLAPSLDHKGVLYQILTNLDLFTVWTLVVIGIGVAAINRKRSWYSSAAIVIVLFLVLKVGGALLLHAVMPHPAGA